LIQWVMVRRCERRSLEVLLAGEVPEPILVGFEALDDRVARFASMMTRVL
jgi:hypothetical protein